MAQDGGIQPISSWIHYPKDSLSTCKSAWALEQYHKRLSREEKILFVPENKTRSVVLWDLPENENEFRPEAELTSQEDLQSVICHGSTDPNCRFVFLRLANSRGRLCCSRQQLTLVLAQHGVLPAFLDFIFQLRSREDPNTTAMFRLEDTAPHQIQSNPPLSLEQPGIRIQHAFNIIAYERTDDLTSWSLRNTVVHHSFGVEDGKSFWLIIKNDQAIRERITSSKGYPGSQTPTEHQRDERFRSTLNTNLIILEWCTENWSSYIDHLEERVRRPDTAIRLAPVEDLSKKPPRQITMPGVSGRRFTGMSHYSMSSRHGGIRRTVSRVVSGLSSRQRQNTGLSEGGTVVANEGNEKNGEMNNDEQLNDIFTFDDLQKLRKITDESESAIMYINENQAILAALEERYGNLLQTRLGGSFNGYNTFEPDILDFRQQLGVFQSDLESHKARLSLLLRRLERNEEMFKGILQYGNMRNGEYFARSAKASAESMEDIAAKTERDTGSMHGITVLTFVFLPGTFVSTLFSSGIMDFHTSTTTNIGDWQTNLPALKLYFAICFPLMALVFSYWAYWMAKKQYSETEKARHEAA